MKAVRIAIAACAAAIAPAIAFADPISFPFSPETGANWTIVEDRTVTTTDPAKPPSRSTVTATLKLVGETDDGYLIEWVTTTLTAGGVTITAKTPGAGQLMIGIPIRFNADQSAQPTGIVDAPQLIDKIIAALGPESKPGIHDKVRATYAAMDSGTMANRLLQEASLFGQCHNFELDPAEPNVTQFEQNTGMGGPPILTNASATLEFVGSAKKPAKIVISQAYDPDSAAASTFALLKATVGEPAATAQLNNGKLPIIRHSSTITCSIDIKSGEAVRIVSDLDFASDGQGKRDVRTLTITRK